MRTLPCIILTAACLSGCGPSTPEPRQTSSRPAADAANAATVSGRVMLEGTPPPAEVIRLTADPKCFQLAGGEQRHTEYVVTGEGNSLQNVFVYVKDGLQPDLYPVPSEPVVLDQQKCRYTPRVLGIQVGQALQIRNSDPLLHNVHAQGVVNQPFNMGQPLQGIAVTRTFTTREVMVPVTCDVHAWMNAYVGVLEHPFFAVTDASGQFSIPRLSPGTYTIEAWHERLGTQIQQITVAPKDAKNLTFSFKVS